MNVLIQTIWICSATEGFSVKEYLCPLFRQWCYLVKVEFQNLILLYKSITINCNYVVHIFAQTKNNFVNKCTVLSRILIKDPDYILKTWKDYLNNSPCIIFLGWFTKVNDSDQFWMLQTSKCTLKQNPNTVNHVIVKFSCQSISL